MTFPDLPLDPPEPMPECPECDIPLQICRRDYAKCLNCGWENEADIPHELDSYDIEVL